MGRYLTQRYVAVDAEAAMRLARFDQTSIAAIRYSEQATLIHRTDWWAWWSDELLTTAIGLPDALQPQGLSPDAVELITDVWASSSPSPQCGWALLAQVQRVLAVEMLPCSRTSNHPSPNWERLAVELASGQRTILYRVWGRSDDGYLCQIQTERPHRPL